MNLRQEIGGVKLNWRKLNSTADIKTIPFKDFSEVVVFVESDKNVAYFLKEINEICYHGNYLWFNKDGEYTVVSEDEIYMITDADVNKVLR